MACRAWMCLRRHETHAPRTRTHRAACRLGATQPHRARAAGAQTESFMSRGNLPGGRPPTRLSGADAGNYMQHQLDPVIDIEFVEDPTHVRAYRRN